MGHIDIRKDANGLEGRILGPVLISKAWNLSSVHAHESNSNTRATVGLFSIVFSIEKNENVFVLSWTNHQKP